MKLKELVKIFSELDGELEVGIVPIQKLKIAHDVDGYSVNDGRLYLQATEWTMDEDGEVEMGEIIEFPNKKPWEV